METRDIFLVLKNETLEDLEKQGEYLAALQLGCNFWIGDLARYAEARFPDTWNQVFPEWMSQGLIQRCAAVAKAYPREEDRNESATWTVHMQHANKPDRIALVQTSVEAGRTSDEARKEVKGDRKPWLLAIDVNYFLHRFWHSGAGVEAAMSVAGWVQRTVERLKQKGLTDVACCFDALVNHRKALTVDWEDRYKDRPPKDQELIQQLHLVRELLEGHGFSCVSIEGMEGDDVMASYAKQFQGNVTLMTQDKDCRQCLSNKCNMLLDVEWTEDETTGDATPVYKWVSAKDHTEETGIPPDKWAEFQCLIGDNCDGIRGAEGIGVKGGSDLIKTFGTIEDAISAAMAEDERIKPKKRKSLVEFAAKLSVTRQLVTLKTDLELPQSTRI